MGIAPGSDELGAGREVENGSKQVSDNSGTRVGAGNVKITLGGQELALKPSLASIKALSRAQGGIRGSISSVMALDVEAIFTVVRHGLGPEVVKELGGAEKLEMLIYEEGLTDTTGGVVEKCTEYLMNLTRGGRPMAGGEGAGP